jgi:tetratricopeptide (TPR) repeat protein
MTTRGNAGGGDADLRRLLRSLHDPRALRRNPLARVLATPGDDVRFAETVRALVRAAMPAGSRAAVIVERCDIEGLPHKLVAAQLGLSMRHFYRERARSRRILRDVLANPPVAASADARIDTLRDELEAEHAAIDFGFAAEAHRRVRARLDHGLPEILVPAFLGLRARALGESGRTEEAAAELARCEARDGVTQNDCAEFAYVRAALVDVAGRRAEATQHAQRAVELTGLGAQATARDRRVHARMLAWLANLLQADHDPVAAIAAFERARDALRGCDAEPLAQHARILIDLAVTRYSLPAMIVQGIGEAEHALRSASWHGLPGEREWAELVIALGAFSRTVDGDAAEFPIPVLSGNGFAGAWLARMKLLVSRMQTARGETAAALRSVRAARAHIPPGHHLHASADLREAEALNALGDARAALPLASGAIDRISVGASSHYSGAAHLAVAEALARLGREEPARVHCEAGVEKLRHGAFVRDVRRALRFAARLTGDPQYAREERALLAG